MIDVEPLERHWSERQWRGIIAAPRQRNTDAEKADLKAGRIPQDWAANPAKLRQKDRDGRWTPKRGRRKRKPDGTLMMEIATPVYGYKSHVGVMLTDLPDAEVLIADKGYDSDWFREALTSLRIEPCIPGRANRKVQIPCNADIYKQRNRIERMFGRLKDWRRIATRYDRCANAFMSAICIAATVIFWL